ncbi:hypothetical protein TraAM80_09714 [Trypanosoma rangeli]|uniref:Secreted protein n=1 Tax=Trypanosoma rangeli TaxID=5698 RepID=A0A3R7KL64_TRYRA|nr:uncharacterized protein TraAM80_09714 [Trypanosoma rangeli]RNE96640.1 hypothetical protein TraAM80_09714 [Trypanosoma rangeli]|eukprot:RNE96640.1 hypothetical protein TraAM80_09714 [Trypanosoma rangeli]
MCVLTRFTLLPSFLLYLQAYMYDAARVEDAFVVGAGSAVCGCCRLLPWQWEEEGHNESVSAHRGSLSFLASAGRCMWECCLEARHRQLQQRGTGWAACLV